VRRAAGRSGEPGRAGRPAERLPDTRDPRFALEREVLKLTVQYPALVVPYADGLDADDLTHPVHRAVWEAVAAVGGPAAATAPDVWVAKLRDALAGGDETPARALNAVAVEPVKTAGEPDAGYVAAHVYKLQELTTLRRLEEVKSRLQRTNPVEQQADYNRMFGELVALEAQRRSLREQALGDGA
jgi:DNA primase